MDAISSSVIYPVGSDIMNRDGGKGGCQQNFDPAIRRVFLRRSFLGNDSLGGCSLGGCSLGGCS